mgnify:CR=1 FL=1
MTARLGNHGFLQERNILRRNFATEISARHHNLITGENNFLQSSERHRHFNFGDDNGFWTDELPQSLNVLGGLNE